MVFGLFSKEKSLQRTIEKATNKLAQQPDRWGALEKLKEDGTDAALLGLCRRFAIAKGEAALNPLVRYMKTADQLAFPLRVLEGIAPRAKVLEVADELFKSETPGYVRMPDRRIDLLRWFAEWKPVTDDELVSRLTPYVTDFDENVRFSAIDGMANRDPAKIAPPLIAALLRPEEESGRIKRTIVEVLEKSQAPLGDQAAAVGAMLTGPLGDSFKVDGGVIKKR
jgi:hypothetical protein